MISLRSLFMLLVSDGGSSVPLNRSGHLSGQRGHARQHLALQEFQARSAAGADKGHLTGQPGQVQRLHAVAPADDALGAVPRGVRHGAGDGEGSFRKARVLEDTHRTVPQNRSCPGNDLRVGVDRLRTNVHSFLGIGNVGAVVHPRVLDFDDRLALLVEPAGVDRRADQIVDRQKELHLSRLCLFKGGLGDIDAVRFDQRLADLPAQCQPESVGHGSADENGVRSFQQPVDDLDLVRNLRAAEDHHERTGRMFQFIAEKLQFAFHQEAGRTETATSGDDPGDTFGGRMSAVRGAKRVVHIHIRHLCQLFRELRIVGLLLGVVADVLQQQNVAGLQDFHRLLHLLADAIVHECHGTIDQVGQFLGHRPQRHGGLALAVGTAEVGREDDAGAFLDQQVQGGQGLPDAGEVVDDHPAILLFHRHVVIDAHEHAFAAYIQIVDSPLRHSIKQGRKDSQARGRVKGIQGNCKGYLRFSGNN